MRPTPFCVAFGILALGACDVIDDRAPADRQAAQQQTMNDAPPPLSAPRGSKDGRVSDDAPAHLVATVVSPEGNEIGTAMIDDSDAGVQVQIHVAGLEPGPHAVHIHEHGACESPDFKSAGNHYNPSDVAHGNPTSEAPTNAAHHAGDMPNQTVDDTGVLDAEIVNSSVTLAGANALLDGDGSALIVHAEKDDYTSQPSGDAGDRVACAVIDKPA